jgi:hypothetical protein
MKKIILSIFLAAVINSEAFARQVELNVMGNLAPELEATQAVATYRAVSANCCFMWACREKTVKFPIKKNGSKYSFKAKIETNSYGSCLYTFRDLTYGVRLKLSAAPPTNPRTTETYRRLITFETGKESMISSQINCRYEPTSHAQGDRRWVGVSLRPCIDLQDPNNVLLKYYFNENKKSSFFERSFTYRK